MNSRIRLAMRRPQELEQYRYDRCRVDATAFRMFLASRFRVTCVEAGLRRACARRMRNWIDEDRQPSAFAGALSLSPSAAVRARRLGITGRTASRRTDGAPLVVKGARAARRISRARIAAFSASMAQHGTQPRSSRCSGDCPVSDELFGKLAIDPDLLRHDRASMTFIGDEFFRNSRGRKTCRPRRLPRSQTRLRYLERHSASLPSAVSPMKNREHTPWICNHSSSLPRLAHSGPFTSSGVQVGSRHRRH